MHRYENGSCANCQTKETFAQDAKLIVNGKDITVGNYAKILVPEGSIFFSNTLISVNTATEQIAVAAPM